jgi:pimeloyl-ACP methyl ester carboxylesterase
MTGAAVAAWIGISWIFAHRLLHPARRVAELTPGDLGMAYEDVSFRTGDGLTLRGWWIPGRGRGSVVLLPGVAADRADMLVTRGPFLHRAGYDLLVYDHRATGASDGDLITVGTREADDVEAAVTLAIERSTAPVALFGHSLGGSIAILAAARDERVAAVVDDGGFGSVEELITSTGHRYTRPLPPGLLAAPVVFLVQLLGGFDLRAIRPIDAAARLRAPLLVMAGEADRMVPVEQQRELAEHAAGPTRYVVFEGAGHGDAHTLYRSDYEGLVLGFLDSWLLSASGST